MVPVDVVLDVCGTVMVWDELPVAKLWFPGLVKTGMAAFAILIVMYPSPVFVTLEEVKATVA
jgi:hypothetical protein